MSISEQQIQELAKTLVEECKEKVQLQTTS